MGCLWAPGVPGVSVESGYVVMCLKPAGLKLTGLRMHRLAVGRWGPRFSFA